MLYVTIKMLYVHFIALLWHTRGAIAYFRAHVLSR